MLRRVMIRLRVKLHGPRLVADLAAGVAPTVSAEHWTYASLLVSRHRRRTIALGIERLVVAADETGLALTAAIPPRRAEVRAARADLHEIVAALLGPDPVRPEGVAVAEWLLTSVDSPAFAAADPGALGASVEHALAALPPAPVSVVEPSLPRTA